MKKPLHIIDVSEGNFDYEVLVYSKQTPVVVDFWAEWCVPCRTLGPQLERLAEEANGAFRLAKVNVDESQNLAQRYNVRSIPAVKAFSQGLVVSEFVGLQPEPRLREFTRALVPSQADLLVEKANSMLGAQQWASAEKAFRQYRAENPDHPAARLGLIKALLVQAKTAEASELLREFPVSKEFAAAERLRPLADVLKRFDQGGPESDDPLEAAYRTALRLVRRGNLPAAMDGLLDVLRQDKRFRDGEARRVMLAIFEILGDDNPLTREYRSELASVLF